MVAWMLVLAHCVAQLPSWTAPKPDPTKPLGGYVQARGVKKTEICHGDVGIGTYNHAAMLDYHQGIFIVAWKNGAEVEDKSGQRILYSQSQDGEHWLPVNNYTIGDRILFPSMTTSAREGAMFVGPPIHVNGRLYVGASPGTPTGAAQGAQFCLWPDPMDVNGAHRERNCGPPPHCKQHKTYHQYPHTLLVRRVRGVGDLGPIFWANTDNKVPSDWAEASEANGFVTLNRTSATTQADMAALFARGPGGQPLATLPCAPRGDGTLKCEACEGGCQMWDSIPLATQPSIGNERSHYVMPAPRHGSDVILYRSGSEPFLFASTRHNVSAGQYGWSAPALTTIPNDESNINTGPLPDGRVYLLSNSVFRPKPQQAGQACADSRPTIPVGHQVIARRSETLRFRDPITLATSENGVEFDKVVSVMSCTNLSSTSRCSPRHRPSPSAAGGKNPGTLVVGPSYPQGMSVVAPAPEEHVGFYVVATNNKEDVWVAKVPYDSF